MTKLFYEFINKKLKKITIKEDKKHFSAHNSLTFQNTGISERSVTGKYNIYQSLKHYTVNKVSSFTCDQTDPTRYFLCINLVYSSSSNVNEKFI